MENSFEQATQVLESTTQAAENASANQSIIILITGFVVVFLVLFLLIGIIKLYSGIVYAAQKKSENKKSAPLKEVKESAPVVTEAVAEPSSDEVDSQTLAVITAAVYSFYSKDKKVRIKSIRPAGKSRSEWSKAALMQNIPAMRSEGLL